MADRNLRETKRYDMAAPKWGDKMRVLGYFDAYQDFLTSQPDAVSTGGQILDVGAGTAAFAEAWIAARGTPQEITLLEPSRPMLDIGQAALMRRGVTPRCVQARLGQADLEPFDEVLAAHFLEHCPDPGAALRHMHDLLKPGGRLHLVVSKPHWCNVIIWLQWRHRTFREAETVGLLANAGFEFERSFQFSSGPPSRTSHGFVARKPD